ncbi:hypothetical protein PPTG_20812 [Phytophthora nicotianae INRA-310]|uniref:Uncharacterized protein n=1 Tax=Phytophthora nicotianae (strain INRA-310) TaxID=761204 RepID=W2RH34_PHYN3|nr:hypothetical protein PPTG_20812 [Phytophthora nicotianae INRA-310]ETN24738.1 hypothetical protein PPTG_20812 [Phytophthora nicotianae INRA-310]
MACGQEPTSSSDCHGQGGQSRDHSVLSRAPDSTHLPWYRTLPWHLFLDESVAQEPILSPGIVAMLMDLASVVTPLLLQTRQIFFAGRALRNSLVDDGLMSLRGWRGHEDGRDVSPVPGSANLTYADVMTTLQLVFGGVEAGSVLSVQLRELQVLIVETAVSGDKDVAAR